MWTTVFLRRVPFRGLGSISKSVHPVSNSFSQPIIQTNQFRALSRPSKRVSGADSNETPLPEAPPMLEDDISFVEELVESGVKKGNRRDVGFNKNYGNLPEAPEITPDLEVEIGEEENVEEYVDLESVPYFPPIKKIVMLTGDPEAQCKPLSSGLTSLTAQESTSQMLSSNTKLSTNDLEATLDPIITAWAKAAVPTPVSGPMPLHELANRSTKIKELVKLGVDMSKIVERHGDMERLLLLSWEEQVKPQIRFLVDCGIKPDCLGTFFTRNTKLLWTDRDDIQVRINYLEAKLFTPEDINKILNKAPFWLTLSTKELDQRLGFIQRTFQLTGSDVRSFASTFPTIVSSKKWDILVNTSKLLDREFGFEPWERKQLLLSVPQCYMRPLTLRNAFNFCHNQIGLTHSQLVSHANLLVNRLNRLKPRYDFLKFLKRDIFNISDPLYVSPDWLWQGTVEEFCEKAAKSSVEDFEKYLKYSTT